MTRIILHRLALSVPLLILVSLVAFSLQLLAPVDPARMALTAGGTGVTVNETDVQEKRQELGLNRPIWQRYVTWCGNALRFDFGNSWMTNRPVVQLFRERLRASVLLTATAWLLSIGVAIPAGLLLARYAGSVADFGIRVSLIAGASLPGFWIALLGMWLFAAKLHWIPAIGDVSLRGIALPAAVLALHPLSRLTRLVRATTLDIQHQEFVTVARAKGIGEPAILLRHILPNALIPVFSVIGLDLATLFSGAAVIEWIFAWPGIGRLSVDAAATGDVPVLMLFVLVAGCAVVMANLLADVASVWVDPRQRGAS